MAATANWRWLEAQIAARAFSFALAREGKSIPTRMAMMVMTTSNSINVKARTPLDAVLYFMNGDLDNLA